MSGDSLVVLRVINVCFNSTTPVHSFMDYIKGGCQVSLMVAIDFTVSQLERKRGQGNCM